MAKQKTAKPKRHWWTVLLLYPEYLTDDYGQDIFMDWSRTATPEEAIPAVQRKAVEAQHDLSPASSVDLDPEDFKMVAVWRGRSTLALDAYSTL